jgi:hypothetical protein
MTNSIEDDKALEGLMSRGLMGHHPARLSLVACEYSSF